MKFPGCEHESEIAASLREGRWPEACDPSLRAHVDQCRHCADFVLVAQTLQQARVESGDAARLAPPGLIWWRAQLRRRNGAVDRVNQPVALAEKLAFVGLLLALGSLAVWQQNQIGAWVQWLTNLPNSTAFQFNTFWTSSSGWIHLFLIGSLGTMALLGGLAAYLLARDE
jgi:hypothetical protein